MLTWFCHILKLVQLKIFNRQNALFWGSIPWTPSQWWNEWERTPRRRGSSPERIRALAIAGFKERSLKLHRSRAVHLPGKRKATWGPEGDEREKSEQKAGRHYRNSRTWHIRRPFGQGYKLEGDNEKSKSNLQGGKKRKELRDKYYKKWGKTRKIVRHSWSTGSKCEQ